LFNDDDLLAFDCERISVAFFLHLQNTKKSFWSWRTCKERRGPFWISLV